MENTIEIFDLTNLGKSAGQGSAIAENEIRFYYSKAGGPRIYISMAMSKELLEAGHTRVNFAKNNLTGEFYFVFGNEGYDLKMYKGSKSYEIGRLAIWKLFLKLNNLPDNAKGKAILSANLSNSGKNHTYKILQIINQ